MKTKIASQLTSPGAAQTRLLVLAVGIVAAGILVMAWSHFEQKATERPDRTVAAVEVHGEPIQSATPSTTNPGPETTVNDSPKRKHPKPPSVQRRMLLAQLAQSGLGNPGETNLASGTLGTAADLARTNLISASSLPAISVRVPGYAEINFSALSDFDFVLEKEMADGSADPAQLLAKARAQIPAGVQSLDGKKVVIQGFLLPVKMDDGLAVEFLLMRSQSMCCYGVAPKINEWLTVQMTGKGVKPVMDRPVAVMGVFHVGPMEENGFLTGIYRLDGERVLGPF